MAIIKVWIEEGCIVCNACEAECPDVFHVTDDTCVIKGEARQDGQTSENRAEKAPLKTALRQALEAQVTAAAAGCPVNVIKYEQIAAEAPAQEAPRTAEPHPAPEPPAPVAPKVEPVQLPKAALPEGPEAQAPGPAPVPKAEPAAPEPSAAGTPGGGTPGGGSPGEVTFSAGPYVYDPAAAPNRKVELPRTVPLPSFRIWREEQAAAAAAEVAKWKKTLADFEAAKAKAEAEGKEPPKAPARPAPKVDAHDMKFPAPQEAADPDLLHLQALLGDKVQEVFQQGGELTCQVDKDAILLALELCREDEELKYEMLSDETATHYPAAKDFAFSVVYHLTSLSRRKRLRLRILVPEGFEPESAVPVYPTANWLEREIWDMFGVRFRNHPDMTRILCPEDWEGHPLRKEYPTVGLGQRDIDFREDRSGVLMRLAMEKAGFLGINLKPPTAD